MRNTVLLNSQLEAFMAVARCSTVHGAARAIHISQTAVTQRILSLEQKLNSTLFVRTYKGMQLTQEGEKLLRYCHTIVEFGTETLVKMQSGLQSIQRIKISGPSSIMSSRVIPICLDIMKNLPMLYITFDIDDTDQILNSLRMGISQFSILRPELITSEMTSKLLQPEEFLLVCASKWKKRSLREIVSKERIIDFDENDQTTINYLRQFNLLTKAQPERLFVNRTESLLKMLIEGYGYGVLSREFSDAYIREGVLITLNSGKALKNYLSLAWYKRPSPPHYFLTIIDNLV